MQSSTGAVTPSCRESAVHRKCMRVQVRMTFYVMGLVMELATGLVTPCVIGNHSLAWTSPVQCSSLQTP